MRGSGSDESLSVVDATGRPMGSKGRSRVHRDGLWHEVFHCQIVRSTPPTMLVLQRRRLQARAFAGLLDLSVTGHLLAGEAAAGGVRELREELGIDISPDRLVALGTRLIADDSGEGRNRELAHVFLLVDDRPLVDFRLDPNEVGGLVEISADDLLLLLRVPDAIVPCFAVDTAGVAGETTCTRSDLVPPLDGYWTVLAVMADRFVRGESPLAI